MILRVFNQPNMGAMYGDTKLFYENHITNNTSNLNQFVGVLM